MKKIAPILALSCFMLMIIVKPDYFLASAGRGFALFATSVLPALFPFFFCSALLTRIGGAEILSRVLEKPTKMLFRAPKEGAYAMVMAAICGYPIGAATTRDLYNAGFVDDSAAKKLAAFASTSGPLFMLGTVGSAIFNDYLTGIVILISHYIAAILNGILFSRIQCGSKHFGHSRVRVQNKGIANAIDNDIDGKTKKNDIILSTAAVVTTGKSVAALEKVGKKSNGNGITADSAISAAMYSSTAAMLSVGGYIVLCNMLIDAFLLIPALNAIPGELSAVLFGAVEMTRGCIFAAECGYLPLSGALASGIISLGGLSVFLQSYSYLSECGVSVLELLVRKICQSVLAFLISFCIFSVYLKL